MTTMQAAAPMRPPTPFARHHRWDRVAFPLLTALVWVGILMGFGGDIAHHMATRQPNYPLIVHLHAAAFLGWLTLFTVQVALVRTRRVALHRRLGFAMLGLATVMVVLGPATGLYVDHQRLGTPESDPSFVAIQLLGIAGFAALVGAAVALREKAAAHKRLMLLSLIYISDAGFARWLAPSIAPMFAGPWLSDFMAEYLGNGVLILALGAYDLASRGRLHPAYVAGALGALALEIAATTLHLSPAFKPIALRLIGG